MFTFREKQSQVPPVHHASSPENCLSTVYIINLLEVEVAGVSPSKCPAYLAPALCVFGLLSVVFSASPGAVS
jgi:hypothetical protein